MKQYFPFLLFLISPLFVLQAQDTLRSENNLPRENDYLIKEQVTYRQPGESGNGILWDFGGVRRNQDYPVNYFSRGDIGLIGAENGALYAYLVAGDSLLLTGYENPHTLVRYRQPGLLMRFPISYEATSQGEFQGRGKHHDRWESIVSGEIQTTADAAGSIVLPGRDTLNNVIRLHVRKIENSRYIPVSSGFEMDEPADESLFSESEPEIIITDTYQWYEEGFRYPVFETIETYRAVQPEQILLSRNSYLYHPADQAYLPEDAANQRALDRKEAVRLAKALEDESNVVSFQIYPNPIRDRVEIELEFRQPVDVEASLWSMQGQFVGRFPSRTSVTHYRETMDVRMCLPGTYLIKVFAGDEMTGETIIKQ
jgi:hypothetical protein